MTISQLRKIILSLSVFFCCIVLFSWSRVTQDKFSQVKTGMTTEQVITILGEPTRSESINIGGIAGTSSVWRHGKSEIDIQFLNGKVIAKVFNSAVQDAKEPMLDQPRSDDDQND